MCVQHVCNSLGQTEFILGKLLYLPNKTEVLSRASDLSRANMKWKDLRFDFVLTAPRHTTSIPHARFSLQDLPEGPRPASPITVINLPLCWFEKMPVPRSAQWSPRALSMCTWNPGQPTPAGREALAQSSGGNLHSLQFSREGEVIVCRGPNFGN